MKNIISHIMMALAVASLAACDKDGDIITTGGAEKITLIGNTEDIILSADNKDALALTLNWNDNSKLATSDPNVLAPDNATTNMIQMAADETFATVVEQLADGGAISAQFTVDQLNSIAGRVGLPGDVSSPLYIRIKSTLANNIAPDYSNTLVVNVTPFTIDMTVGYVLTSKLEDSGARLSSPESNGIYKGFLGVSSWYNFYLQEGSGVTWGNDGVTGTPFLISSEDTKWNFWFPGLEGCYYTIVDTQKKEWSALLISSLTVSGDISGDMTFNRKTNQWTLTFNSANTGNATIRLNGNAAQYNVQTSTDDAAAIAHTVSFGQNGDALSFAIDSESGDITVNVPQTGETTLTVDLNDPNKWLIFAGAGTEEPEPVAPLLYMSGIDDGISGSWTFDNYLRLCNEDELAYAGACNVNSLWGYLLYKEAENWGSNIGLGEGDAASGSLVTGSSTNLPAPEPGLHLIYASLSSMSYYTFAINSVQITGINDNWDLNDMEATETLGTYKATIDVTASTPWGFQIILNSDWGAKFGGGDGVLTYLGGNIPLDDSYIGKTITVTVDLCKGNYTIE
ncbi:MAG: DUF5114 domain-containing protein [Prevotella sp.]